MGRRKGIYWLNSDIRNKLIRWFPNLGNEDFQIASPEDQRYNCHAWAMQITRQWWEPDPMGIYFWPESARRDYNILSFVNAYSNVGYFVCADGNYEEKYEKLALYAKQLEVTHTARQLPSGKWASKLGRWVDIEHTLQVLEGNEYGNVAVFMKRPSSIPNLPA